MHEFVFSITSKIWFRFSNVEDEYLEIHASLVPSFPHSSFFKELSTSSWCISGSICSHHKPCQPESFERILGSGAGLLLALESTFMPLDGRTRLYERQTNKARSIPGRNFACRIVTKLTSCEGNRTSKV